MPVAAVPAQPYPKLVRARVAAGWDPARAAAHPYVSCARLTAEEVALVRTSMARSDELAGMLSITIRQVQRIRAGYRWKAA